MKTTGHVYFIKPVGMRGPIKIGFSASPLNRLEAITVWSPFPLEVVVTIPGARKLGWAIHRCLASAHSHHEWFHATDGVVSLVEKLKAGVPIEQAIDLSKPEGSIRKPARRSYSPEWRRARSARALIRFAARRGDVAWPDVPAWVSAICEGQGCSPDQYAAVVSYVSELRAMALHAEARSQ
jgi:hypothetical protein